jgi:hypothetical protein
VEFVIFKTFVAVVGIPYYPEGPGIQEFWDLPGNGDLEGCFERRPVGVEVGFLLFRVGVEKYCWRTEIDIWFGHLASTAFEQLFGGCNKRALIWPGNMVAEIVEEL